MNRPLLAILLGTVLGAFDGSTAWFTAPELRAEVGGIIAGSCMKGVLVGLITGLAVRRVGSLGKGLLIGAGVAVVLAIPIAIMNANYYDNQSYYWKIILPGALTGAIVGYATVRYGSGPRPARAD
ncbi:MAG TPA: hypothetical protein VKU85_19680 [bacterium]|nr:hypothetical protein [bacterium]